MFEKRDIKDIITRTVRSDLYVRKSPRVQVSSDPFNALIAVRVPRAPLRFLLATSDTYMGFIVWAIPTPIPRINRAKYSIGTEVAS